MAQQLKYRITEILDKKPYEESVKLRKEIPEKLGIASTTFRDYCLRKIDEATQIPSENLILLAMLLEVKPIELFNEPPTL